jgi:hypothetical protein
MATQLSQALILAEERVATPGGLFFAMAACGGSYDCLGGDGLLTPDSYSCPNRVLFLAHFLCNHILKTAHAVVKLSALTLRADYSRPDVAS